MSRSGYTEDVDTWQLIKWRGQVASAIRGKRGQRLLYELLAALDAMPAKRLIRDELIDAEGEMCALGALAKSRGIDTQSLDPEDYEAVANTFDIAHQLAQEIVYMNDEFTSLETPEQRWKRMRQWVSSLVKPIEIMP